MIVRLGCLRTLILAGSFRLTFDTILLGLWGFNGSHQEISHSIESRFETSLLSRLLLLF
jgi:hypothetical protein